MITATEPFVPIYSEKSAIIWYQTNEQKRKHGNSNGKHDPSEQNVDLSNLKAPDGNPETLDQFHMSCTSVLIVLITLMDI